VTTMLPRSYRAILPGMVAGVERRGISDDLAHGQIVIVTFRWLMVAAGFVFALWNPGPVAELRMQILVIFALAVANFYLHSQLLMGRPSLDLVVYAASAADIALITVLVASAGGFTSPLYIFYYPAVLVFSVVFPTMVTLAFTAGAMSLYLLVSQPALSAEANLHMLGTRLLTLGAVALCGAIYWCIERDRRRGVVGDRGQTQEAAEDLFFGQIVIIVASWSLVVACTVLVLWNVRNEFELVTCIVPVAALMAMNFFLHGRYLLGRPANRVLTLTAAVLNLIIITVVVFGWPGLQGLQSQFFVLYYPLLVAVAFVFAPTVSLAYTALALVAYIAACLLVDTTFLTSGREVELLVQRLTTLAATGALAAYYWRVQRARRRAVAATQTADNGVA